MAKLERSDKPVSVLVDELSTGALGLPEIQRGYVWNRPQARDLIDSLYREYPSGLILLWKPKEFPVLRETDLEQKASRTPELLVLDGQQRLTSLKKVFDGEIDVYFNVEEEGFQIYSRKLKADPLWISVKSVVRAGAVKVWRDLRTRLNNTDMQSRPDEQQLDKYLGRLAALERIREYRYPVMIIHTDDYEEITESFIRVNSRGTRLKAAELAMAKLALHWPGALVGEFENALDDYEQAGFDIEARFLIRCYVAVATGQSRFGSLGILWKKKPAEREAIWKKTRQAVDYTINFLRNNAGIESSDWVPSINALVPVVAYFSSKRSELTGDQEKGLLFWLFQATVHGRFTGSPETKIDQDLRALESLDPIGGLVANLKRGVPSFEISPEMVEGRYQRHAFLPVLFAICRQRCAKDWFTGTALSSTNVGPEHQLELHHIFPKAVLKKKRDFKAKEIDDLSNIAFVSRKANRSILKSEPSRYLPDIEEDRLRAQYIPMQPGLWEPERFRDFLGERRKLITAAINDYMKEIGGRHFQRADAEDVMQPLSSSWLND
jgi:hypothetical protein